jgi:regulatory protein YycH of two-component signal transduction system YycFG
MRYETIKSAVLSILVFLSILLTWNLWTYQPHYETMEKSNYVAEVTLSEKQEVQKIVQPDHILFHIKGEHYGTNNPGVLEKVIKELSKWTFTDVKDYTSKVPNIKTLIRASGNAEIIFAGEVPIELYRSVLNIEARKIPTFTFNRIIINVENPEKENGIVYFVSTENQKVYSSHISLANVTQFNREFVKNADKYPRYFAFDTNKQVIFLPDQEIKMTTYKYLPVTLNSEEFKDALFSDPSFVQKSFVKQGEEYTNGSSKMTVNNATNMLLYVNPTAEDNYIDSPYDLVKRSIDFVNEHGGWTDDFRFVSQNVYKSSVTFRMYSMNGYPIFNETGLAEIDEVWGQNEINKYVRPNISLDLPLTSEMQMVTIPSGHDALKILYSKKNFRPELLEDLVLGYRLERDVDENKLILLEPAWFYRYDKTWGQITTDELGGPVHGLE